MELYGYIYKLNSGIIKGTRVVIKFPSSELKKSCSYVFETSSITFDGNPVLEDIYKKKIKNDNRWQIKLHKIIKSLSMKLTNLLVLLVNSRILYQGQNSRKI